jgi:TRAP-type C4-dicarboxylate transport system substrate-binding protein
MRFPYATSLLAAAFLAFSALGAERAEAKEIKIKLGTLAPEGSPWYNIIKRMGQRMKDASGGTVTLTTFAGGVAGDEGDMVRKMRVGQLHAATITGIGLSRITRATIALQIPMTIDSYEELDYIRERIGPKISAEIEKNGFIVLNWGDAGWVHFFSKGPASTPDDYLKLKMFIWSGDPESANAWKSVGFTVVPLSATDVLSGLKTGLVDWFATTPLYAETSQWFTAGKYMEKINWTPLNGATIVSKAKWNEISPELREKLKVIALEEGAALNKEVRTFGDRSIKAMVDRGLKVTVPDAKLTEEWTKLAHNAYPEIRGKVVPTEYLDEVVRLSKEFREKNKK